MSRTGTGTKHLDEGTRLAIRHFISSKITVLKDENPPGGDDPHLRRIEYHKTEPGSRKLLHDDDMLQMLRPLYPALTLMQVRRIRQSIGMATCNGTEMEPIRVRKQFIMPGAEPAVIDSELMERGAAVTKELFGNLWEAIRLLTAEISQQRREMAPLKADLAALVQTLTATTPQP